MTNARKKSVILFRVVLYVAATLFVMIFGAFLALQTGPVRGTIKDLIENAVAENTRASCRIDTLSGNLLSRFECTGIALADSQTGVPLVSVQRIAISYSIPMLLGRVLWINRLTIDGLSVHLAQGKDGKWNFEMLVPEPLPEDKSLEPSDVSASAPWRVEIRRLMIDNSDLTLVQETDTDKTIRHFSGVGCQARLGIGNEIFASIKRLAVRLDNPHIDLADLSGGIRYDFSENQMDIDDVRVKGRNSNFTVSGLLRFLEHGPDMVNMDLRAEIDALSLGEFGRALSVQMPDSDIVSGDIHVQGPISKMDCMVDLRMDRLGVKSQGFVMIDESYDVGLDIAGKINGLDLATLPLLGLKDFPGDLNTGFTLKWQKIGMPEQAGRILLDLSASKLWDYSFNKADLDVRIAGADFIFERLKLKTPYGNLDGTGRLAGFMASEKNNQVQFSADIDGLNPATLLNDNQYAGAINGHVSADIFIPNTFDTEEITAEATGGINLSRLMDMDILSGDFAASWADEKIVLKQFQIETSVGEAEIKGSATLKDETCSLKVSAILPDLNRIIPFIPDIPDDEMVAGSVAVNADISGSFQKPDISATVKGEKVGFREVSADFLSVSGDWHGSLKEFRMSGNCRADNIHINGVFIPWLDLNTSVTPGSIQAGIEAVGGENDKLAISGNIIHWMEPVKEIAIDRVSLTSFDQPPMVNREPVKMTISRERICVDSLHLDSGKASVVLKGEVGLNAPEGVSVDLAVREFNLKRISGFWEGGDKINGWLSSDLKLSGILENPVINMETSVRDASYGGGPATDITVGLNYQDSRIEVNGSGFRQQRKIVEVNGSAEADLSLYPFVFNSTPETLLVEMDADQVDISELPGFLLDPDQLKGTLSSHVRLSGCMENPVIDVKLSLKDGAFDRFSVSDATASMKYSDSRTQLSASAYRQDKKLLEVNGTALMNLSLYPPELVFTPGGLDLTMDLKQVDISWISDIIDDPEYDVSGILGGKASISGDFSKPEVQGNIELTDGTVNLKKQHLIYENLSADLRFAKEKIFIDKITVKGDKEGTIELSGDLSHENLRPRTFNIRAVGDNLYIPFHTGVDTRINPDLLFSGTWESPVITGKIKVTEGRVNLERFLEDKVSEIEIVKPVTAENGVLQIPDTDPEPLKFVDGLTADVAVIIPNDFWFRGKDEFIEIKGNIQLKKDPRKPFVLYGSVFPVRGTYRFRGRLFQIKQGELAFAGQEDINPSVNIEAVNLIDDVKIIIRLTGTFQQLNLILDSDPAMDQSEIISFLIFGRAPDDLSEKESFQAGEAALSFTGQIAADKLRDLVGDALGIDYLNISAGSGGLRQGSLTMGKYVLPKVFVTFRQGFDETVTQKVEVTYEINKNFDLETQIDSEQTSALDLIWKYEF